MTNVRYIYKSNTSMSCIITDVASGFFEASIDHMKATKLGNNQLLNFSHLFSLTITQHKVAKHLFHITSSSANYLIYQQYSFQRIKNSRL